MEINNLISQVKLLTKKVEDIQKENELKIEAVKKESKSNYIKFAGLINEFLDKISLDLTQKVGDIKNEMKEKLDDIIHSE